jgi:hypothetical protein
MEVAALLGLIGLGYGVAKLSEPTKEKGNNVSMIPGASQLKVEEGFTNDRPMGGAARGFAPDLDHMYQMPSGQTYPSEPSPGPHGNAFGYATQKPPIAPKVNFDDIFSSPESLEAVKPSVAANPTGIEENPDYSDSDFVVSPLTGQRMPSSEFKHNNMVPFFGGRVKQNVAANTNSSLLDSFTGSGIDQIKKKEVETMFNTAQTPFGNPYGLEASADFLKDRINTPRNRGGERPFEPTRVGPALGEKHGLTGKGGFQQMEVNDIMRAAMPTTEKLRVADNPKLTFKTPVIPGQRFITSSPENPGEIRKYRPDRFYIDDTGERYVGAFSEESQRETSRPIQTMKHVTRPETSSEIIGPAQSQDFGESYVTGAYRTPMAQQYGGAGFRNANMNEYYTNNPDAAEADYGKSSIEMRPNERSATSDRTMGLNLSPADTGQVAVHYEDDARPTRRGETVGNIRQSGTATGYAQGAPSITVWDPSDVARTTVKETTIEWGYLGNAAAADAPTKLKVYDPDDIAKPTQKSQLSAKSEYFGGGNSVNKDFTSHDAAYNMRTNPNKEQIAKGRKPIAGNGNIGVFTGEKNGVTYKKLDADSINDRALAVNSVVGLPPGSGDIGRVQYRVPLKLDIASQRNDRVFVASVEDNPLNQSLRKNAELDLQALGLAH